MSTFLELQNLVISGRFSPNDRTDVKAWINARGSRIWTSIRWQFQPVAEVALPLTLNSNKVLVPATMRVVEAIYNDQGDELERITRDELFAKFKPGYIVGSTSGDRPTHYAVVNRTIYLGPMANAAYAYSCSGMLVWGHDDGAGNFVAGDMVADTDKPYWPDNHHYVLVAGAKATGTKLRNDPTYPAMDDEFNNFYAAMVDELAEDHGISSYGVRDPL